MSLSFASFRPGRLRRAFTLTELLATLVVVSVVGAIAFAGFSRFLSRSDNALAEAHVEEVYRAQMAYAALHKNFDPDPESFVGFGSGSYQVSLLPSDGPGEVSMAVGSSGSLVLTAAYRDSGCFTVVAPAPAAGVPTERLEVEGGVLCDARAFLPAGEYPLLPLEGPGGPLG